MGSVCGSSSVTFPAASRAERAPQPLPRGYLTGAPLLPEARGEGEGQAPKPSAWSSHSLTPKPSLGAQMQRRAAILYLASEQDGEIHQMQLGEQLLPALLG